MVSWVGVVGGLPEQRGVAGRVWVRMQWWLCVARRCEREALTCSQKEVGAATARKNERGLDDDRRAAQQELVEMRILHPGSLQEGEGVENATCGTAVGLNRLRTPYATISLE